MFLNKIGYKVGKVIRIDKNTTSAERDQFTRLSVEIDISRPLLSKFQLNGKIYGIQYEGLKLICFKCGKLGHSMEQCFVGDSNVNTMEHDSNTEQGQGVITESNDKSLEAGLRPEEKDDFGAWIMVKKPQRRKPEAIPGKQASNPIVFKFVGFSGGIWLYWRTNVVTVNPVREHAQFITVEVARNGDFPWFFSAVYASPDPTNRRELWTELENFARDNNRPWIMVGDFNETRSLSERHGGDSNMARRCGRFNNWIENCDLIELAFTGPSHTWARGKSIETRQSARLDRALCNADWGAMFEEAMVLIGYRTPMQKYPLVKQMNVEFKESNSTESSVVII
ncbi:uncharacterized protein LOC141614525 [Silene latifolia]|uniref:uncharacterized protein LOC141614525 n=1 Tax=Silene latifolia TaxID=37657 RepID=UPI003D789AB6